jgi:hypothetical protein
MGSFWNRRGRRVGRLAGELRGWEIGVVLQRVHSVGRLPEAASREEGVNRCEQGWGGGRGLWDWFVVPVLWIYR